MNKSAKNAAFVIVMLAVGAVGFLAGSFMKPSGAAHAAVEAKSIPAMKSSARIANAVITDAGAQPGVRRWRCLAENGGYFTDSEAQARANPCAEVKPEVTVWQCIDGGGRAQYSLLKSGLTGMSCAQIHGLDSSEWVETLNSPAFRQWIENRDWEVREKSRSDDVARVRALVQSYYQELADASEIREKYANWKDIIASRAFNDWLLRQPAEVKTMKAELTIGNVRRLMERYTRTNPQKAPAPGDSPAV